MAKESLEQHLPDSSNGKFIYICSDVRSGSTLLDMLLGRHSCLISVGELHHLYNYLNDNYYNYKTKENLCTCGKKVTECNFWKTIENGFLKEGKDLKEFKTRYVENHSRISEALFKITLALLPPGIVGFLSKYSSRIKTSIAITNNLQEIYRMINLCFGSEYVVDSSKSPENVKYFSVNNKQALKVIFLKRDLRAIVFSKNRRRPERGTIYKSALHTFLINFIINLYILYTPKKQRLVLKYESLVKDPQKNIKQVCDFMNLDFEKNIFDDSMEIEYHNLGGSPHRFTNKSFSKLKPDERWKSELSKKEIFILNLILKLPNKINGY